MLDVFLPVWWLLCVPIYTFQCVWLRQVLSYVKLHQVRSVSYCTVNYGDGDKVCILNICVHYIRIHLVLEKKYIYRPDINRVGDLSYDFFRFRFQQSHETTLIINNKSCLRVWQIFVLEEALTKRQQLNVSNTYFLGCNCMRCLVVSSGL